MLSRARNSASGFGRRILFVDFDHGLNTAINQLRGALGDSAASPRFIQTLPRRGYRFIAPVELAAGANVVPLREANADVDTRRSGERALVRTDDRTGDRTDGSNQLPAKPVRSWALSDARELPIVSSAIVRVLFSLIQLMYLSFYIVSLARLSKVETIVADSGNPAALIVVAIVVTAAVGIPVRLYLLAAAAFNYRGLNRKFQTLFPFLLLLDELWALAPFLLVHQIGIGLAIGLTAALLYLPFSQRSLLLMDFSARRSPE